MASLIDRVDMLLENARFCVNCEVVTSAPDRCLRCGGPVVPLSSWIKSIPPVAESAIQKVEPAWDTYAIRSGMEDEEDGAVYLHGDGGFTRTYLTHGGAFDDLTSQVGPLLTSNHPLYNRLHGVISVWEQTRPIKDGVNPPVWCIIKIIPKIKQ